MLVWMSGPLEAVKKGYYTNGPSNWCEFTPDKGDIIVAKQSSTGITVVCETWEGISLSRNLPDSE